MNVQGRFISADFGDFLIIGSYTPCSMLGEEPTLARVAYDAAVTQYIVRQRRAKPKRPIFMGGDLNVAPTSADAEFEPGFIPVVGTTPGLKPHEVKAFDGFLRAGGLVDIRAEMKRLQASSEWPWTWERGLQPDRPESINYPMRMNIDHWLGSEDAVLGYHSNIQVEDTRVTHGRYGSDHRATILGLYVCKDPVSEPAKRTRVAEHALATATDDCSMDQRSCKRNICNGPECQPR